MASHVRKEPAWLTAAVDQRLAKMREKAGGPDTFRFAESVVLTPLTEPWDHEPSALELERWDRTCDNCGTHCPEEFYTGSVSRDWEGVQVVMTFGVCPTCKAVSGGD